jgi:hypothetical protein
MASQLISAKDFCVHHHIEISFLHSLCDYGLLEITTGENEIYLQPEDVSHVEKLVRLHYDLHINLEGIDAIHHLLHRMEDMQEEMLQLKNRLRMYENE